MKHFTRLELAVIALLSTALLTMILFAGCGPVAPTPAPDAPPTATWPMTLAMPLTQQVFPFGAPNDGQLGDEHHELAGLVEFYQTLKSLGYDTVAVEAGANAMCYVKAARAADLRVVLKLSGLYYYEQSQAEMAQDFGRKMTDAWQALAFVDEINRLWPGTVVALWIVDDAFNDLKTGRSAMLFRQALKRRTDLPLMATVVSAAGWVREYANGVNGRTPPDIILGECYPAAVKANGITPGDAEMDAQVAARIAELVGARELLGCKVGILLQGFGDADAANGKGFVPPPGALTRWQTMARDAGIDVVGTFGILGVAPETGAAFDNSRVGKGPLAGALTEFGREIERANAAFKTAQAQTGDGHEPETRAAE